MNLNRYLGLSILLGLVLIIFIFVLSPQPQFDSTGFYQPAQEVKEFKAPVPDDLTIITPEDILLTEEDFEKFEDIKTINQEINADYFNGIVYQVGAFSTNESALNLVEKFKLKGFPAKINISNGLFFVMVGPFLNQKDLDQNKDVVHAIAGISEGKALVWKP
ncbi:MAG: SPOR domain-containing protein [Gammaproteobacteria bacterium]